MKQLIKIVPWTVSLKTLSEMGDAYKNPDSIFGRLPEWCLRDQEPRIGKPMIAHYYHQFTPYSPPDEDKKYFFFSISPVSNIISEEVSQIGMEQFLEDYNFQELFKEIPINSWEKPCLPKETLLVFDLEYVGWGEDFDLNIIPIGYLNNNFEVIEVDMTEQFVTIKKS